MNQLVKNRIQKQLLNFDQDIEFNKSNSVQKTIEKSIEREKWILDNMVDLGLPSGTLWMKNNLEATCENTPESWYGDYYAFGELETKLKYSEDNYTYKDIFITLPLDHDVIFQKTNSICHIPTKEQLKELVKETKNEWIENYNNVKGLNGRVFTGLNGNRLFIPAAGYYLGSRVYSQGSYCHLWTSSVNQNNSNFACYLYFYSGNIWVDDERRHTGLSIRGVL